MTGTASPAEIRFDEIFERVIGVEGGYVNDPRDPGGETKYGITARTLETAIAAGVVLPGTKVKTLNVEVAKEIYRAFYWQLIRGDELPKPIDEYLFDYAVNSGVERAAAALQGAVGALQDGRIGPRTLAALRQKPYTDVLRLLFVDRAMTFALSPNDKTFGRGWFARLFDKTLHAVREAACA